MVRRGLFLVGVRCSLLVVRYWMPLPLSSRSKDLEIKEIDWGRGGFVYEVVNSVGVSTGIFWL